MSIKESWAMEPDMGNRDPQPLNDHLKVEFEDVLGEPDHTHSIDCTWKYSYKCFNLWKTLCYLILSTLCGIIHASCWGCGFACVAFMHIWEITPCFRCCDIWLGLYRKCTKLYVQACVEPYCDACGSMFANFKK